MIISLSKKSDIPGLYKLWRECFGDSEDTIDLFFKNSFDENNTIVCHDGEKVVSMLFLLPEQLKIQNKSFDAYYIYAAATDKDYRRKGIMSDLIAFSSELCKERNIPFLFLVPAEKKLFDFYSENGFETAIRKKTATIIPENTKSRELSEQNRDNDILLISKKRNDALINCNCILWREYELKLFFEYSGGDEKVISSESGYCSFSSDGKAADVTEFLPNPDKTDCLINELCSVNAKSFTLNFPTAFSLYPKDEKIVDVGMVRQVCGEKIDFEKTDIYIGFTLN